MGVVQRLIVKVCPGCRRGFTLEDLVYDKEVEPVGMQFENGDLADGLYHFNHGASSCGTRFSLPVQVFLPLIEGWVSPKLLYGTDTCENLCLRLEDLRVCDRACYHAPFRRFLVEVLLPRGGSERDGRPWGPAG